MDYKALVLDTMRGKSGEYLVTDMDGEILFRNNVERFTDRQWKAWAEFHIGSPAAVKKEIVWEISDRRNQAYFRVLSVPAEAEGKRLLVHHIYNTSDYANLLREVSGYSKEWQELSKMQTNVLERLSGDYMDCMTVIIESLDVDSAVLFIEREKCIEQYTIEKGNEEATLARIEKDKWPSGKKGSRRFLPGFGTKGFICYVSAKTVDGARYSLFINDDDTESEEPFQMQYNVIRLFIENCIMREQIIYESEHDQLTGLYNKGKYLAMMDDFFPNCRQLAVYNMDVNYLKRTNDTYGHEAGDALIVKAAKSLLMVEREKVRGFRMGGDEFMLLAWDLTEEEAEQIRIDWREALAELNTAQGEIECVIACGLAYGEGEIDIKELLRVADERMYENKVEIKKARGDDPNAR
ncbi:MAG: GGDEF domain-containing protein [Lachnospiraceae bacterium]|nr:GGDEF domain-containing protein [Lachnospiraceae bacterium]